MKFSALLTLLFCCLYSISVFAQLQSPEYFFQRERGSKFTLHHQIVDYFEYAAESSPQMVLKEYGKTNQGRPVLYAIVSSAENIQRLEQIRLDHLKKTGLVEGKSEINDISVVWLSYGVHGNEAGATESACPTLYELLRKDRSDVQSWLEHTIVIIDPSLNPDGFSRYTHWYRNTGNVAPNVAPQVREHNEPWPGGRVNHYLFDLNRDWAWQTQVETEQRMKIYHQWMPHIHVDFHEMYYNDPYYFAPAAQPFHTYITDFQSDFQMDIGKNNARYFDKNGWLYFTREVFDLFYPSYGDTYPTFHGAVGMTYEQGGHSRAGLAIQMLNGDTLRLSDRIAHHVTTGLSTVEVGAKNSKRLNKSFSEYFKKAKEKPVGKYHSYVVKADNGTNRLKGLCDLLDKNQIRYGRAGTNKKVTGYDYTTAKKTGFTLSENDLVISAYQPLSVFVQVLFDPEAMLVDSLTYDITAWALPYAHGLQAYATEEKLEVKEPFVFSKNSTNNLAAKMPYAYIIPWESIRVAKMLGELYQNQVRVRCADTEFRLNGESIPRGSLIITRADNKTLVNKLPKIIRALSVEENIKVMEAVTGFTDKGPDLGSSAIRLLSAPKVLVLGGEGVSALEFGQVWYFFEQKINYPVGIIAPEDFQRINIDDYNVLILPEGSYSGKLTSSSLDKIKQWIRRGGNLIAMGRALRQFEDKNGFYLTKYAKNSDKSAADRERDNLELEARLLPYHGSERRSVVNQMPGAIVKLEVDNTHPLAYGLPKHYFSLKTNTQTYQLLKKTNNVAYTGEQLTIYGFAGSRVKKRMNNNMVFGVQEMGKGEVIYMVDNPLFRGFWENGNFLFGNAIFLLRE